MAKKKAPTMDDILGGYVAEQAQVNKDSWRASSRINQKIIEKGYADLSYQDMQRASVEFASESASLVYADLVDLFKERFGVDDAAAKSIMSGMDTQNGKLTEATLKQVLTNRNVEKEYGDVIKPFVDAVAGLGKGGQAAVNLAADPDKKQEAFDSAISLAEKGGMVMPADMKLKSGLEFNPGHMQYIVNALATDPSQMGNLLYQTGMGYNSRN